MAAIFISHSRWDDALASSLADWLKRNGFDDFYIDHESNRGGDKWAESLRRAKSACRVVLCLVTPEWLSSDDCFGEFVAGWYMGRRTIPLITFELGAPLDDQQQRRLNRMLLEDQGIFIKPATGGGTLDLDFHPACSKLLGEGLRAAGALAKVGLDPHAFDIDKVAQRNPFPGLASFGDTDADAAIFFGRSQEIARCLEDLRHLRATGDRRAYILLGASGSGKSSLMKAGILPRLRRERGWFALRVFRPGTNPLLNFAEAIVATAGAQEHLSPGSLRDDLLTAWRDKKDLRAALNEIIEPLKLRANRTGSTTLISIDQGEELINAQGESADVLCALMLAVLAEVHEGEPSPYALMFTFRSDSFREFEKIEALDGLETRVQNVRALPVQRYETSIVQPALRYKTQIEPELVDLLTEAAEGQDAMPLLAFALQRLWRQYGKEGLLRGAHYEAIGKLSGIIEDAGERALRGLAPTRLDSALTSITDVEAESAGPLFVPALAKLNEHGGAVRRTKKLTDFEPAQRKAIGHFVDWRLLTTSGDNVEVAHEAIFREWPRLTKWIKREHTRLETLRALESAADAWAARGRTPEDLSLRGKRLSEAEALLRLDDYRKQIEANSEADAYLKACLQTRRHSQFALAGIAAAIVATIALAAATPAALTEMKQAEARRLHEGAIARALAYVPQSPTLSDKYAANHLAPLASFRDCDDCPELVIVPGGKFIMGSPDSEMGRGRDEGPQRRVSLRSFAIGKFDVTFDDWDRCVADKACRSPPSPRDYHAGRGRRPLIALNFADAHDFTRWLSTRTGQTYRLPSEAEWEYAARAGTTTPYYTGQAIGHEQANFGGAQVAAEPVGAYPPNPFHLYDMAGSVWQWTEDCYVDTYAGAPDDNAPVREKHCLEYTIRGGSWANPAEQVRSATRTAMRPSGTPDHGGLRVVRELGTKPT